MTGARQTIPVAATGGTDAATNEKPSLLFVDDERAILNALRVVFRSGYDVTVTTNGFEAVELLKTRKFHVVVSDQKMPEITGVEVLAKARECSPHTVRILLTGYSETDAILGAINDVEVHRFAQKPWANEKIRKLVDEAIHLSRILRGELSAGDALRAESAAQHLAGGEAASLDHSGHLRETILIVDSSLDMYRDVMRELSGKVDVIHAKTIEDIFKAMAQQAVSIMVCSFDPQSEADRAFLQLLKRLYPFILVIAVCDSVDAVRLIELINQAKIFRYVRKQGELRMLSQYITSAVKLAEQTREHRHLVLAQRPEEMTEALASSSVTKSLTRRFESLHAQLVTRIRAWVSRRRAPAAS